MMRIESTCKYMLPCGLCELKNEPCTMSFNHGITFTTVPLFDINRNPETNPFMNPDITCDSSAQENKDITV